MILEVTQTQLSNSLQGETKKNMELRNIHQCIDNTDKLHWLDTKKNKFESMFAM